MNAIITRCRQVILAMTVLVAVNISAVEPEKCKPCAAAAAARLSAASAAAAAAAALSAGKPVSREMELDVINSGNTRMVEACCAFCAQIGSLGCQGENSARCATCQAGLVKISIAEAAAALAAVNAVVNKRKELDPIPSVRAPREELADPCNPCGTVIDDTVACDLNCKLQAIFNCCVNTNQQVRCQGHEFERCCKRLRHNIDDVEDLVESQIDQSIECCSIIETRIGDLGGSAIDIPACSQVASIVDVINTTDVDVITWLKSLYILLFQVYQCTCSPCLT